MWRKFGVAQLFRTKAVIDGADLIAVKMLDGHYEVIKSRPRFSKGSVTEDVFKEIMSEARLPIVLSEDYIETDSNGHVSLY